MAQKLTCPVCKSKLQEMTKGHLGTKKHAKALKNAGVDSSKDPALEMISKPQNNHSNSNIINQMEERILNLEDIVYELLVQQEKILNYYEVARKIPEENKIRDIPIVEVLGAINNLAQNNKKKDRWVKIDAVVNFLKLNREIDIVNLNKLLTNLFNKKLIDLADAGDSKHPIIFQNRTYGKVALSLKKES